ncbi:MAG TPA: acyl-CoA reductase [Bacteroidia bacterium]|nr:acyl-CoA reductase [Bacteroidia bacterium]
MQLEEAIESFNALGEEIKNFLEGKAYQQEEWEKTLLRAEQENPWFTQENIRLSLGGVLLWLDRDTLNKWLDKYPELNFGNNKPLTIGVVMAGNIPLVGFHDFLCVLISGNKIQAKLSHADQRLLPFIAGKLIEIEPEWKERIEFVDKLSTALDGVIATGSNNTAKHFEFYFKNVPNIIRRNRNGIAILDGAETNEELHTLGQDIFSYFGLGCRNVSKVYVPEGYVFDNFFRNIESYKNVINHNKYHSNYVYNRTIYLMDGKVFTDNGFLAVINNTHPSSPIAVLNFEEYKDMPELVKHLTGLLDQIQCVAVTEGVKNKLNTSELPLVNIGETQSPTLSDYADGVDVMKFLFQLNDPVRSIGKI